MKKKGPGKRPIYFYCTYMLARSQLKAKWLYPYGKDLTMDMVSAHNKKME